MKEYFLLFREPDGRETTPEENWQQEHQQHWKDWMGALVSQGRLIGGKSLSLNGKVVTKYSVTDGPCKNGKEIVGGYFLLKAESLDEAVELTKTCPIFEAGGYAEVREVI